MRVYLDDELIISGSGFRKYEPVIVFFDLGDGQEPTLGFPEANKGGAWSLRIRQLDGENSVSRNADDLLSAGVVTLKADGADGSAASVPIHILGASTPVVEAGPEPGAAPSLTAGIMWENGELEVVGAGFNPNENVTLIAITGVGTGIRAGVTVPGAGDIQRKPIGQGAANDMGVVMINLSLQCQDPDDDDDDGSRSCVLAPGAYTLEAFGADGSLATSALVVSKEKSEDMDN